MTRLLDACWRAAAYCLLPRVLLLSLLPLLVAGAASAVLAWFYWEDATTAVRQALESSALLSPALAWLERIGAGAFRAMLGPLVVVALAVPVVLVLSLLLVAAFITQPLVELVARRRFPALERRRGGSWWWGQVRGLGLTVAALLMLLGSLPLWLLPPLVLVLPPLIWGWLTAAVLGYDTLAGHADARECRALLRRHRLPLLMIGVAGGYLAGAPSLLWAGGVVALPMMPLFMPLFVWAYTAVFVFTALWMAHYTLAALHAHRGPQAGVGAGAGEVIEGEATVMPPGRDPPMAAEPQAHAAASASGPAPGDARGASGATPVIAASPAAWPPPSTTNPG